MWYVSIEIVPNCKFILKCKLLCAAVTKRHRKMHSNKTINSTFFQLTTLEVSAAFAETTHTHMPIEHTHRRRMFLISFGTVQNIWPQLKRLLFATTVFCFTYSELMLLEGFVPRSNAFTKRRRFTAKWEARQRGIVLVQNPWFEWDLTHAISTFWNCYHQVQSDLF